MEKIEFKDLPDTTTSLSASNLNTMQNNIEDEFNKKELQYIIATINNTQTTSTDYYVTLNTIHSNQGNFTLSNGAIVIGEGIHHIRISASIFCDQWATGDKYLWTKIYKNSTFVSGSINSSTTGVISSSVSPIIIEVQQNDEIKLMADTYNTTATIRQDAANTFLCVEKID